MPPALAAAFTGIKGRDRKRESIGKKAMNLLFIGLFLTIYFFCQEPAVAETAIHINGVPSFAFPDASFEGSHLAPGS